jgi:REP element-mobilizing transposase RayT
MPKRPQQIELRFRARGGSRPGAGRKRSPSRLGLLPHVARPRFDRNVPVHVTIRAVGGAPSFRTQRAAAIIFAEILRASSRGFRVVQFSVQGNHLHLIVEADDGVALSRGMQRLASRLARLLNALVSRRGSLWRDRYHRRDLATPRQFRNALVYVLFNHRRHAKGAERARRGRVLDRFSSVFWVEAWAAPSDLVDRIRGARAGPPPLVAPKTWIASRGWKRHGLLRPDEMPAAPA